MASVSSILAELMEVRALFTSDAFSDPVKTSLANSIALKIKSLPDFPPASAGQMLAAMQSTLFANPYKGALATAVNERLETGLTSMSAVKHVMKPQLLTNITVYLTAKNWDALASSKLLF